MQIPESEVAEYKSKLLEHAVKDFSFTKDELAQFALSLTDRLTCEKAFVCQVVWYRLPFSLTLPCLRMRTTSILE